MPQQLFKLQLPSQASIAHRQRIAQIISPLKRVRPHVPFWKLAAHRVPTLWTLYRGLLKYAGDDNIKFRIRRLFHIHRSLTSPDQTIVQLRTGHKWLELFKEAHAGDAHLKAVMARYARLINHRRKKVDFHDMLIKEAAWQLRLRTRPILTGAFHRPTFFNGPLPRLKPQPLHIGAMIRRRIGRRDKRLERLRTIESWLDDIHYEAEFERNLSRAATFQGVFGGGGKQSQLTKWQQGLRDETASIQKTFQLETARASQAFPPSLLKALKDARVEKYYNKKRESEREARGEVLNITLKRRKSGFPVAVREEWDRKKYREMHVMKRSKAVVGYVGMLKRKYGWKVPPEEDTYEGRDEERLRRREETVRIINLMREAAQRRDIEGEDRGVLDREIEVLRKLDEEEAKSLRGYVKTRGRLSLSRYRELVRDFIRARRAARSVAEHHTKVPILTPKQWKDLAREQLRSDAAGA